MKMDADEKELLDSVERGEWKTAKGGKRERARYSRYAKATFRKGPAAEHPAVQQGPGGYPEACAGRRPAVPDADLELAAQVCNRTPQGGVIRLVTSFSRALRRHAIPGWLRPIAGMRQLYGRRCRRCARNRSWHARPAARISA